MAKNIDVLLKRADKYSKEGRFKLAVRNYYGILKENPDNFHTLVDLGHIDFHLNEFDLAIENLKKAEEKYPNDSTVLLNLGCSYAKKQEISKAIYYLKKANTINPNDSFILFNLGAVYGHGPNFDLAVKLSRQAEKIGTKDSLLISSIYSNLASIYYTWGKNRSSKANLIKAIRSLPKNKQQISKVNGNLLENIKEGCKLLNIDFKKVA